jgi:exodeoxyribonuclease VII small subunit
MSKPMSTELDELTFGSALAELDEIVAALEGGQLELEDSLGRYERGVSLLRALQTKLADAQQKVTMLIGELESEEGSAEEPSAALAALAEGAEEVPF